MPYVQNPIYEALREKGIADSRSYYYDLNRALRTTHHTEHSASNDPLYHDASGNRTHSKHKGQKNKHHPGNKSSRGGGRAGKNGGGGGGMQGANSIPDLKLPDTVTSGTPSASSSPFVVILLIAAAGLGGWYWWHKAHLAAKQDQQASKK